MLTESDLAQCHGTEHYYRHSLLKSFVYTDGVKLMADNAGAYWLIDAIASYQPEPRFHTEELKHFQLWELEVEGSTAVLTCKADSDRAPVVTQDILFTDFPFSIKLYVEPCEDLMVLLLTSEH